MSIIGVLIALGISTDPGFIFGVRLLSALIIGALLYFLVGFRLGIMDVKKKLTIVAIFIGMKIIAGIVDYI